MFGYLSPEDVFKSVRDIEKDIFADPPRRGEILRLRAKDPRLTTFENLYRRKDGSTFWGHLTVHTVMDVDQKALYFEGFIEDVTTDRAMEEALRESEEKFRSTFQNSASGVALIGLDGRHLMVNPVLCEILGYSEKELLATDFFKLTHPDDREISRKVMLGALEGKGKNVRFDKRYLHKDGHTIWTEVNAALVYGTDGKPSHFISHVVDITRRKQAEEALRESEERYRMLFELSPDSIAVYQDGKIIYANPATFRLLGAKAPEEIIGRLMLDFVHPDYREMVLKRSRQQEREGKSASPAEEKFVRRDGSSVDVEVMAAPFQYRGKLSHLVISRDITERKRADEMLREQEERFRTIFENANVGVCIVGLDGRLIQVNRQMSVMFGYSREELERMTVNTIASPEDADLSSAFMQQAIDGETAQAGFDKRYIHKDGHVVWGHVSSSLVRDSKGNPLYFISHVQDITERKQADEALRESEEKFAKLFQDAPVLIIITDTESDTCLDVNEEALRVFGYRRDEVIGNKLFDLGAITRENRDRLVEETESRGRITGVEMNFRAKDGHTIVGLFRAERISISGRNCMLGAMVDITERKQAEEALRALALRHEALLSAIPEIIMEVDSSKVYTWANPAGKEFFGEDVIGKEAASYFEGEQDIYATVQPIFNGNEDTIYVESWQRRKDGQKRLLAWWCRTLKDDRGTITGALSSARDITDQRMAEEKIQNLSRFPEENPNPVMRMTPDGVLLYANQSSRPFLTYWNIGVGQIVPEDCRGLIREAFASQQGTRIETRIGERIFNCTIAPIISSGYVNVYARDITDRKRAEEALTRQTEELRQRNLELARVNELTDRRLQQLAAMRTVDMAISSSFKSELVMEILLEQLTSQLKIHAADILIFHPAMQGFRFFCGRGFYATPSTSEYLRLADSYAGRAAQERQMIKVPRLDEKADQPKIFPRIAKEGFVSYACLPLIAKGQIKGVMEICQRDTLELGPEEDSFLEMLAGQAAIAVDNAEMFGNLQSSRDELQLAFNSTLAGWARALELRDREAEGETQRAADQAMRLAQMLGESDEDLTHLYRGAILHDIGMMSVPDDILLKHGPLTDEEWTIVRRHPQVAFDILSPVLFLRQALDIPHCHHEKWDGSGYPRGLKGEHIPLAGRIFAVVDVSNALRSDRPYRKAWKDAEADEYIRSQSGKQFDPAVVQAFFRLMNGH
ncbi:MAG: PAS domain S-box protein [Anaerolineales bacterium]|jgi:PAS domain S-box-containing protein